MFPALEAANGPPGLIAMMRMEHEQMRALVAQMNEALAARNQQQFLGLGETLMLFTWQHNMKEENIRLAAMALLITVGLGLLRSASYAGLAFSLELANITNLHLAWGLCGWVVLLVMGVSYQVIPMFHVTPNYPPALTRALPLPHTRFSLKFLQFELRTKLL